MPPETKAITRRRLPAEPKMAIASFFTSEGAADAIRASQFDLFEEVTLLVNGMRDADPRIALTAQRQFRGVIKQIADADGVIVQTTEKGTTTDGHTATVTASRIVGRLAASASIDPAEERDAYAARSLTPVDRSATAAAPAPAPAEGVQDAVGGGGEGVGPRDPDGDAGAGVRVEPPPHDGG